MYDYDDAKEILKSNQMISQPIEICAEEILNSDEKLILLGPDRGVGKSILLNYLEQNDLKNKDRKTIYMRFDSNKKFQKKNSNLQEHYYEIVFSLNLLYYIKINQSFIFNKYFKNEWKELNFLLRETINCYNESFYGNYPILKKFYKSQDIVLRILKKWQKITSISKYQLLLDRFDATNANDEKTQLILSRYFELFDKTIITTEDKYANYNLWNLEYSKDVDIVTEILKQRMMNEEVLYKILTKDLVEEMIKITNGNLHVMISTLNEIQNISDWEKFHDLKKIILKKLNEQEKHFNELDNNASLKLYL